MEKEKSITAYDWALLSPAEQARLKTALISLEVLERIRFHENDTRSRERILTNNITQFDGLYTGILEEQQKSQGAGE
jgi:hypothetical protein